MVVSYMWVDQLEVQKMFSNLLRSARKVASLEEVRLNQDESVGTYIPTAPSSFRQLGSNCNLVK